MDADREHDTRRMSKMAINNVCLWSLETVFSFCVAGSQEILLDRK